jgi:hypothetical protein
LTVATGFVSWLAAGGATVTRMMLRKRTPAAARRQRVSTFEMLVARRIDDTSEKFSVILHALPG